MSQKYLNIENITNQFLLLNLYYHSKIIQIFEVFDQYIWNFDVLFTN
jgi:hypothetical protein